MRPIKFRAWDKKTKEYFHISELWNSGTNPECFNFDGWTDNFGNKGRLKDIAIEQYTGVKDAYGKEIYEGDLIITHPEYDGEESKRGIVQYGSCRAEFSYEVRKGDHRSIWTSNKYRTYEVIGNVHTNPELLEAQHG